MLMSPRFRLIGFISIALVVGFLFGYSFRPGLPVVQVPRADAVHVLVDFGDGSPAGGVKTWPEIPFVTGATAFSILKDVVAKEQMPFVYDPSTGAGVFIRQIGDKKNGDGGRYWQYWVNAQFGLTAADRRTLSPGDTVEWKFANEQR